jgi:hypothetical protein
MSDIRKASFAFARVFPLAASLALFLLASGIPGVALADPPGANHETSNLYISNSIGYPGGSPNRLVCPDSAPYMVGVEGRFGNWIDAIAPLCTGYNASGRWNQGAGLAGPSAGGTGGHPDNFTCPMGSHITRFRVDANETDKKANRLPHVFSVGFKCGDSVNGWLDTPFTNPWADCSDCLQIVSPGDELNCPDGLIARGMQVSAAEYVNSVALICGPPPVSAVHLGRVQPVNPDAPRQTLCEAAASARARNSPVAPSLEARCQASKGPPVHLGRVVNPNAGAAPPTSICDAARSSRARNSPAAPALERQCIASGGSLAPLPPFDPAVVDALALAGAEIADIDLDVADARDAVDDADYQRGFDIGTGLFGDPALGAQGNTQMGPGSTRIRDSLNAAGQNGFDDSMKFHLARDYRH